MATDHSLPTFEVVRVPSRLSQVRLFVTPWTVTRQAPQSMEFSRQEYWSGLPVPSPGDLPNPGIKPMSLTSPALAGRCFTISTTWEAPELVCYLNATGKKKRTWGHFFNVNLLMNYYFGQVVQHAGSEFPNQ